MLTLPEHIENRDLLVRLLREELVGPSPQGEEIECNKKIVFNKSEEIYRPWKQKGTGEEILQRDTPCKRYGVGVLYPVGQFAEADDTDKGYAGSDVNLKSTSIFDNPNNPIRSIVTNEGAECLNAIAEKIESGSEAPEPDDFDLSAANKYRQSSMGVSFFAEFTEGSRLLVEVPSINDKGYPVNGRYRKKTIKTGDIKRDWWLRDPVTIEAEYDSAEICSINGLTVTAYRYDTHNIEEMDIRVEVFSRQHGSGNGRLITVCLVNRKESVLLKNEECLFQSYFKATVIDPNGLPCIMPYPGPPVADLDDEEQSLSLLYRHADTFAVGHGCSADWMEINNTGKALWVSGECLPVVENPSVTPDIIRDDGSAMEISMAALAGLVEGDDGFTALSELIILYEKWIKEREGEISCLDTVYHAAAQRHLRDCKRCLKRMCDGLAYLQSNDLPRKAFELANHAILLQQIRGRREPRWLKFNQKVNRYEFSEPYLSPLELNPEEGKGKWRAFQAAFLLMTVQSTAKDDDPDRDTIDLIWFPTGGGKTEAYLGLAAFSIFLRRLKNKKDKGVHVLMRYTLRLLTAQQFLRAAGLLCSMEYLRRSRSDELGEAEFSIGLWLGSDTTPNSRKDALAVLRGLQRGDRNMRNRFVLNRCPWCGAQIGPIKSRKNSRAGGKLKRGCEVPGYEPLRGTVVFTCTDKDCIFMQGLPIYVIDEDIYEKSPSLIIGTVDKFAMLAWKPEARAIFGINTEGKRVCTPPSLIIQDELHLISGPLGSVAGLYEAVIENLCSNSQGTEPVVPKIVCSTATIRRYSEQVRAIYGREDTTLFPPPGLSVGDSFFGRYAKQSDGSLSPGQMYVGVHAPGLGSMQTVQVRTFATLLQEPVSLTGVERDPWWTLLVFFNSLRELGTTLSLFQSDIPNYLTVMKSRKGLEYKELRRLYNVIELTGRLKEDEIPEAISALEVGCTSTEGYPVDACLASNIIEVGIDIERLSLMTVVGQPKTTSQYIQVTGRIGRRWWERPGLVVTLYSATKPRDRSHFEKFRSYHERLYAQVEPTSVTPFSPPVLDRALHAIMAAYVRQMGDSVIADSPYPYPDKLIEQLYTLLFNRIQLIDPEEISNFKKVFRKRVMQWQRWECTSWDKKSEDYPLLRVAGDYVSSEQKQVSWATQRSMRNVDAQCQAEITRHYQNEAGEGDD